MLEVIEGASGNRAHACAREALTIQVCFRVRGAPAKSIGVLDSYLDPTVSRDVIVVSSTSPTTLKQRLKTKVNLENSIEVCEKFIQERNLNEGNK